MFNDIAAHGSSYVCRVRDNSVYDVVESRPLTPAAQQAYVTFDAVVRLGQNRREQERPQQLIALRTGKKPTKRTYEMICFYFIGWADEEELLAHLEKLKAQNA